MADVNRERVFTIAAGVSAFGLFAALLEIRRPVLTAGWRQPPPTLIPMGIPPVVQPLGQPSAPTVARCLLTDRQPLARRTAAGTLSLSPDQTRAVVADADADMVVTLAVAPASARAEQRFNVGRSPAQVLLGSDGRVFVSERRDGTVAVFDSRDGHLLCRANVAADPVGLALSPDEQTLYVTSGVTHTLTALNASTFAVNGTVQVPREPRGITVSPDGRKGFITHVSGQPLSAVDLGPTMRARTLAPVPVPPEHQSRAVVNVGVMRAPPPAFDMEDGPLTDRFHPRDRVGFSSPVQTSHTVTPVPSQAWSVAFDPAAQTLVLPFMVNRTGREVPPEIRVDAYGAGSVRQDPGEEAEKISFALARFDLATERWGSVTIPSHRGSDGGVRIPAAVAIRPTDHAVLITSMGTAQLATLAPFVAPQNNARRGPRNTVPTPSVAPAHPVLPMRPTLAAPCGIAVTANGTTLVYSQIDHTVEVTPTSGSAERISVGAESLPAMVARGRRLFFTANDPRISSGGLSCGGCHPDGRDDGLVWFLSHGPRQTPTLAERLVGPFSWVGTHNSLEGNIAQTVGRLGGTGLPLSDVDALAEFLRHGLIAPDAPNTANARPVALSEEAEHGRQLFNTVAGCNTCHDPARNFTDGLTHELGGLGSDERDRAFDTPSLRFVSGTAPYFHDGRYASMRALLTDPTHRMGHVEVLHGRDLDAMEAYLATL